MSANSSHLLEARSTDHPEFNVEFPLFVAISALLSLFFLLYFNRVFASIVSYGIRAYTWHRHRVYIDIKALQISLLGGRIFFTGLRYHGSNESFLVQYGSVTWRYWLRHVREVDIRAAACSAEGTADGPAKNATRPCRINVHLVGLEWFVYNRSPAYDTILAGLDSNGPAQSDSSADKSSADKNAAAAQPRSAGNEPSVDTPVPGMRSRNPGTASEKPKDTTQDSSPDASSLDAARTCDVSRQESASLPFLLQLLPIHVDCEKPAVVIGNETTKAILVVKADSGWTDIDASATQTCDQYRQTFKVRLHHPVAEMKENLDFKEDLSTRAARQRADVRESQPAPSRSFFRRTRRRLVSSLRDMVPYWRRSVESFSTDSRTAMGVEAHPIHAPSHWLGLSRYLDDQYQDDKARWASIEYGAIPTILDSPEATITVFWDAVGPVTEQVDLSRRATSSTNINGCEPPAWGISVSLKGGTVSYGPWADRHRANLQRAFFPSLSKDACPASVLPAGAWRVPTSFTVFVELEDTVTIRIPTKEESKNWRWRGKEPPSRPSEGLSKRKQRTRAKKSTKVETSQPRPAGWLEIKVPSNATVAYSMDMLAGPEGFKNRLDVDLPSTELWSSVNHDLLWRSGAQRISCRLDNPLSWNALRQWHFVIDCTALELFLLRDHVFLLVDLVDDWSSGPPAEYLVFTPFTYHLRLNLRDPRLYINVNDANIIDNATALDDNAFLILSSPLLNVKTSIPLDNFRPSKNAVPFDIRSDSVDLALHFPQSATQAAFLPSNELGHADGLVVSGSYEYNSTTSPANTDTLILKLHGKSPSAYIYGFIPRYMLLLKDNYFGDHVHFKTRDEHQEQLQIEAKQGPSSIPQPPIKQSNDLDVILSVSVDEPRVMLPANLYSADSHIQAELSNLSIDVRFTNYFMDLELVLSPLSLSMSNPGYGVEAPSVPFTSTQLFIDGLRLFGHRAFGLPPSEPTYLCNWNLSLGSISGECSTEFLATLARAASAFMFTFDDVENALVPYSTLVFHDITFVRVTVDSVRVWLRTDEAAFLLSTDSIEVDSNDWARSHYSKRASISIPNVQLSCVNAEAAARHQIRHNRPVETLAFLRTDIRLTIIGRKFQFTKERKTQQDLVRREDQRTGRVPFLLLDGLESDFVPTVVDPPAQCSPIPPFPVTKVGDDESLSLHSSPYYQFDRLRRQSSFLSSSSIDSARALRKRHANSKLKRSKTAPGGLPSSSQVGSGRAGLVSASHDASKAQQTQVAHEHTSVTFSSQYSAPHFPLESVQLENHDAAFPRVSDDCEEILFGRAAASLRDIDPEDMSEDHAHTSFLIEFPSGISSCIKPDAVRHAVSLLAKCQPLDPETILDSLQTDTIDEIFNSKKPEHHHGKIRDILVRLPGANFRVLNQAATGDSRGIVEKEDQYDLKLSQVLLMTRTVTNGGVSKDARTSLHFRLKSAQVSASERLSSLHNPQAAVAVEIDNVVVSLGVKDVTNFDAEIGSVVGRTMSGSIDYLASLMQRTGVLATDLKQLITTTLGRSHQRTKYLTYRLLSQGQSTNDPAFLTRPSAVLRSAPQHMRTCDSWKMAMRLRQIWAMMRTIKSSLLADDCRDASCQAPADADNVLLAAFLGWRSWDLEDAAGSVLLSKILGKDAEDAETEPGRDSKLVGTFRLERLQLVLDPGPKQNALGLIDVALAIEQKSMASPLAASEQESPLTICSVSCSDANISLNWELCELVEHILRMHDNSPASSHVSSDVSVARSEVAQPHSSMHVVLEVKKGSVDVETVHLSLRTLSNGLKTSVLLQSMGGQTNFANALVNCNAVTSRLHSHSHLLGTCQLRQSTLFVSHEFQETETACLRSFKSTASCQDLAISVKQDPIALLETADLLVKDETAQLHRLSSLLPSRTRATEPVKIKDRLSKVKINVAMFLDSYALSIPLLQSLAYTISGDVARVACAANYGEEVILDFDVKENSHKMQIDVRGEPRTISLLNIPPINGRTTYHITPSSLALTLLSSIEVVHLDASAVYGILAALNRPQVFSAIKEMQQQTHVIREHMTEVFGSSAATSPTSSQASRKPLTYNVHLTLAGLRISTKAALTSKTEPVAQVLFSLDKTHVVTCNQDKADGAPLQYPDLHISLQQLGFDVRRGSKDATRSCGSMATSVTVSAKARRNSDNKEDWHFNFHSDELDINLSPVTVSTMVDVMGYMGSRIKDLDTSRELDYLRKLRQSRPRIAINDQEEPGEEDTDLLGTVLASVVYQFELRNINLCWNVAAESADIVDKRENLLLAIRLIEFGTKTRKSARLTIERLLLQTAPAGHDRNVRSLHSALLPEVIFKAAYVSTTDARRMAFQATGESLDVRLTSAFIVPAAKLIESISLSMRNVQKASLQWSAETAAPKKPDDAAAAPARQRSFFGNKRLESLLIDADFAGAVVYVSGKSSGDASDTTSTTGARLSPTGKYGQFNADDSGSAAVLRTPGIAWKAEYRDDGKEDPSLYSEVKIDASSNTLYPSVVPLMLDIMSSVKEVVSEGDQDKQASGGDGSKQKPEKSAEEDNILIADPSAVLGRLRLNLGLRICKQKFSLSCQPVARVAATASYESVYFTINTVNSQEQGSFFAVSGTLTKPQASVQHVYSRDPTASIGVDTVTLSFINSKHVSGTSGVSAILKVSPMRISVIAKQLQDFLLFREIWYPDDLRQASPAPVAKLETETSQGHLVQRYQQVAATTAFPWTATVSIAALDVQVDLGQAIGKSAFQIDEFWVSFKKTSDWDQNLCLGFRRIGVDCSGRLSGFVALQHFRLRTSIQWPKREEALNETPLIQASVAFNALRVKAAFDYQAFLVADITSLEFMMYNIRDRREGRGDRLVAVFDGDAVQVFGTTASAAQAVALYQAILKLVQERKESLELSLQQIEKFRRRAPRQTQQPSTSPRHSAGSDSSIKSPISLDTDVVVTLRALNLGVFPSTFFDHQVFKMEALNTYARFAASMEQGRIHSTLRMTLGQLRIGLAGVRSSEAPKSLSEMTVEDVVQRSTGSRGGTILKVPRVEAVMQTWQSPQSNQIDYVFKSAFEGKVEVGWNYSRISYIRGMWASHSKSLEQTWGRQLPMTAVRITGMPQAEAAEPAEGAEQQKIRAEVKVPQSRYEYVALEPPVIETPQLRDMGEATPPLEWIGFNRDKMPNLTHQIVIVSLLELAGEVEDAYSRILGSC